VEVIVGIVLCAVVSLGVSVYLRFFASEGARSRPFEDWCRTRPLVVALRCQPGSAIEVYEKLRYLIEPSPYFSNSAGRFPWQHYVVSVDGRRLEDDVITLSVTACRQPKLRETRPDLSRAIDELGREAGELIDEVWLHGQLHTVNRRVKVERENMAWVGDFDDAGELSVTAMIGQPVWLKETLEKSAA
jgi:hypothetical protein